MQTRLVAFDGLQLNSYGLRDVGALMRRRRRQWRWLQWRRRRAPRCRLRHWRSSGTCDCRVWLHRTGSGRRHVWKLTIPYRTLPTIARRAYWVIFACGDACATASTRIVLIQDGIDSVLGCLTVRRVVPVLPSIVPPFPIKRIAAGGLARVDLLEERVEGCIRPE